jgi:hypothetical protein
MKMMVSNEILNYSGHVSVGSGEESIDSASIHHNTMANIHSKANTPGSRTESPSRSFNMKNKYESNSIVNKHNKQNVTNNKRLGISDIFQSTLRNTNRDETMTTTINDMSLKDANISA